MSAKKKEINLKHLEKLCSMQCTKSEICDFFDIDEKTLTRICKDEYGMGFSDVYKKKSATGKISLRRYQFRIAETNATMAIWLGKQYLGQRDNLELIDNTEINKQIENIAKLINKPVKTRTIEDVE